MTGVVRGIVYRVNVRKAREVNEKRSQHGSADSRNDALALGGRGRCRLCTAGADGHGASLGSDSGGEAQENPANEARRVQQRPPTAGLSLDVNRPVSGLTRGSNH